MVVRFAIEPDALIEDSHASSRDVKALHKRIIRLWEQYGLLVDPGRGPDSITSKFDHHMLNKVRPMWREAWKAKQRCRRVLSKQASHISWHNVSSPPDIAAHDSLIDLALVESVLGIAYLGIAEDDDYSTFCGPVEAALFRYAERSHAFAFMSELSQRTVIPTHQNRDSIWSKWFRKLAQRSEDVRIIDRYGFSTRGINGVVWTLRSLVRDMPMGEISIYSSDPSTLGGSGVPEKQIVQRISALLATKSSNAKSVTVVLVPNKEMTKDRYMSFNDCAFSIGHGVSEAFSDVYPEQETPCILDAQARGLIRTMRSEVHRLTALSHRKLIFDHGGAVKTVDIVM